MEAALWAGFARASTREAFCASWLALQCHMIGGVSAGAVFWETPDGGSFFPLAAWPGVQDSGSHLAEAAARAASERRGLVLVRSVEADDGGSEQTRFEVAFPVEVAGHLYGVVGLDVAPCPEPQLEAMLRQLQWGFAWLEVMVRGEQARRNSAPAEQNAVGLVAASAGQGEPGLKVEWQNPFGGLGGPPRARVGLAAKHPSNFADFEQRVRDLA